MVMFSPIFTADIKITFICNYLAPSQMYLGKCPCHCVWWCLPGVPVCGVCWAVCFGGVLGHYCLKCSLWCWSSKLGRIRDTHIYIFFSSGYINICNFYGGYTVLALYIYGGYYARFALCYNFFFLVWALSPPSGENAMQSNTKQS